MVPVRRLVACSVLLASICAMVGQSARSQDKDKSDKTGEKTTITIKGKLFNSDDIAQPVPLGAVETYYRPRAGADKVPLRIEDPRIVDGFFLIEVPRNIFLEDLYLHPARGTAGISNVGVESKVVTANDMIIYKAVSPPKSKFSFNAYVRQFEAYRGLYQDRITALKSITDDAKRQEAEKEAIDDLLKRYKEHLKTMPEADNEELLPELSPEERQKAAKVRKEVLQLYGLMPPDAPQAPNPPYPPLAPYQPNRRCCFGFFWCR